MASRVSWSSSVSLWSGTGEELARVMTFPASVVSSEELAGSLLSQVGFPSLARWLKTWHLFTVQGTLVQSSFLTPMHKVLARIARSTRIGKSHARRNKSNPNKMLIQYCQES
jgi:hypothetical protein